MQTLTCCFLVPIWDARTQFTSDKYILDGVFTVENTFKLPRLQGEDLQHGDIALLYHSVNMYKNSSTSEISVTFGLYGAVLLGHPT